MEDQDQVQNLREWQLDKSNNPAHPSKRRVLLSTAYKKILARPLPDDLRADYAHWGLDEEPTYAELIAMTVVRRAVGRVPDDKIDFRAITELRESTEGKTPDKVIAAGVNMELVNLASIMAGGPAPTEDLELPGQVVMPPTYDGEVVGADRDAGPED